jgi:hypothetical protein
MTDTADPIEACPRCKSTEHIQQKLILIEPYDPARAPAKYRIGCTCHGDLAVSDLLPEFVVDGALAQFLDGLYCARCDVGYVPDSMAKPDAPTYRPADGGWRRVYADGTLGPRLDRIADDSDA